VVHSFGYPNEPVGPDGGACFVGTNGRIAVDRGNIVSYPAAILREPLLPDEARTGAGRSAAWMRVTADLSSTPTHAQLLHRCWLAYMSDDMPADTVRSAHPDFTRTEGTTYGASLDHTIWFHRPLRADDWHLYDFSCHGFTDARGLGIGHVFTTDGTHVATVAQEFLMRSARQQQD
jgi:acyl-CoA thioesterase-2